MFFFIQLFVLDFFMTSLQKPAETRRQKSKACRNGQKKQIREVNSETDKASKLKTQLHNSKACRNPASKAKAYRGCILVCPGKKAFNFIKKDYARLDLPGSI